MSKRKNEVLTVHLSAAGYLTSVASIGEQKDTLDVRYVDENIWLIQKMMVKLYDVTIMNIIKHIRKIYADEELARTATTKKYFIVQDKGGCQVNHWRWKIVITMGFKVNSERVV